MKQEFKKATIIFGKDDKCKLSKANEITSCFKNDEIIFLPGRYGLNHKFSFSTCNKNTKAIIIDQIASSTQVEIFFNPIIHGLTVNKRGSDPFVIHPEIILICSNELKEVQLTGSSFTSRFNIINTDN